MASGKSIGVLLAGIAIIIVGVIFILILWIPMDAVKGVYEQSIQGCQVAPDPASCIAAMQASYGGDVDLLWNIYLYGGFGCIAGGAVCLIIAIKMFIKGN